MVKSAFAMNFCLYSSIKRLHHILDILFIISHKNEVMDKLALIHGPWPELTGDTASSIVNYLEIHEYNRKNPVHDLTAFP